MTSKYQNLTKYWWVEGLFHPKCDPTAEFYGRSGRDISWLVVILLQIEWWYFIVIKLWIDHFSSWLNCGITLSQQSSITWALTFLSWFASKVKVKVVFGLDSSWWNILKFYISETQCDNNHIYCSIHKFNNVLMVILLFYGD